MTKPGNMKLRTFTVPPKLDELVKRYADRRLGGNYSLAVRRALEKAYGKK